MKRPLSDRRRVLKGMGLGALAFQLAGVRVFLTAAEARAQNVPLSMLNGREARALAALGETLATGADEAGIVHFIDSQLATEPADSLFVLRYLDVPPPYAPFYKAGLAALDTLTNYRSGTDFADLDATIQTDIVREISAGIPDGWRGPPAPFVYFVIRSDAVDVTYGTEAGFKHLGIPNAPHIPVDSEW